MSLLFLSKLIQVLSVILSSFHLYTAATLPYTALIQRGVHLGLILALVFLYSAKDILSLKLNDNKNIKLKTSRVVINLVFSLIALIVCGYIVLHNEALTFGLRTALPTLLDQIYGVITIILVLEATRRITGMALPSIAIAFIIYGFIGPILPGFLFHPGISLRRILGLGYLSTEGIFGVPLGVSATFAYIFILLGGFLKVSGAGDAINQLSLALFGQVRGGPAKAATIASTLFGSISGSAVANVLATGTFTIPLMLANGYRKDVAGGIEAAASTGGLFMPPVMGAAAFVMSEITGISYRYIIISAATPALLYYFGIFLSVDFEAGKRGLRAMKKSKLPDFWPATKKVMPLLVPIAVLVYLLVFLGWNPTKSGFWAIIALIATSSLQKTTRFNWKKLVEALELGAKGALVLGTSCATAGLVLFIVNVTGLGLKLSSGIINLAQGNIFLLLLLTMVACLILGMGLPMTPCYIILAILAAPALVRAGVPIMAAHMFVLFFGALSNITPPVALAAYAGGSVSGAGSQQTAIQAVRIGLPGFFLPFLFIFWPSLLSPSFDLNYIFAVTRAIVVILCITAILSRYLLERVTLFEGTLLVLSMILTFTRVSEFTLFISLSLLALVVIMQVLKKRLYKH